MFKLILILFILYLIIRKDKNQKRKSITSKENIYERKGRIGEEFIVRELSKLNVHHRILSNLYLPSGKGTTEVDIVMITLTGIYVIESKNYTGWIFGRRIDKNWTQSFPKSKFQFYNPVK